jgi:hypothetical protein
MPGQSSERWGRRVLVAGGWRADTKSDGRAFSTVVSGRRELPVDSGFAGHLGQTASCWSLRSPGIFGVSESALHVGIAHSVQCPCLTQCSVGLSGTRKPLAYPWRVGSPGSSSGTICAGQSTARGRRGARAGRAGFSCLSVTVRPDGLTGSSVMVCCCRRRRQSARTQEDRHGTRLFLDAIAPAGARA